MGNYIKLIFLVFASIVIKNAFGIQTCTENIQKNCDCFYYPFFTIKCSHKRLSEYPDFSKIQVIFFFYFDWKICDIEN